MFIMKSLLSALYLALLPLLCAAQPADAVRPDWQNEVPQIVYPDRDMVDLYNRTWEIAADRVRKGPEGLPASPYLDENCYEDQIWIWDACFMVMFSKYAPKAYPGEQTLDNLYLPIHENTPTPLRIHLRDNPPLFAWIEHDNYTFCANDEHLRYVFQDKRFLQRHFDYFNEIPCGDVNTALSPNPIRRDVIKDEKGQIIGYTWDGGASGMDNTPRGRDAGGAKQVMWIDAISQQALSALYISRLCDLRGLKAEKKEWQKRYEALKRTINERYWDERDGFYYDVSVADGTPCRIKTPASFWAMLAEVPSKKQAERMIKYLQQEEYLGGQYPWNTLSRDDRDYNHKTGDYWRGGVWLPTAYMGTKALEKYGFYELADELAERVIRHQLRTYHAVTPHTIWECYSPSADAPSTEVGHRARPDFCGWSALGPISLFIENVLGFREVNALENKVVWSLKTKNGTHGIKRLKFGDTVTDILYNDDTHTVSVTANRPYRLVINGRKHNIPAGKTEFSYKKK